MLSVKPSLITAIADTNVTLDLVAFFNFVPMYDCFPEMEILSLNHSGMSRKYNPIPENNTMNLPEDDTVSSSSEEEKTFFKNSVTVPIRHKTTGKEWVVKINNSGFHICGAKEQEEALNICDQILQLMVCTNNCLMKTGNLYNHRVNLQFSSTTILTEGFENAFQERMEDIVTSPKDDNEKTEVLSYVKEAEQSGIFIPSSTTDIYLETCKLVMINYVYKSRDETDMTSMFPRLEFSKHILKMMPEIQSFRNNKYSIKVKFDYLCNSVHQGGSISMKLRNRETDKSQTIIIHVIKGSVVHSISSMDDLEAGLEFLQTYFPMITQRLVL
jgi:regulator of replication initiation timing